MREQTTEARQMAILPALVASQGTPLCLAEGRQSLTKNPAWVYLQTLAKGDSERTGRSALRAIVQVVFPLLPLEDDTIFRFPWEQLRYEHTVVIRRELADKYDFATANKILSILRQVLKQAWALQLMNDGDYLRAVDIKGIRGTKEPHGRFVNADEFARMVETCLRDPRRHGPRDLALLVVLYVTGIRRKELSNLNYEHYSPRDHSLRILGKGNKKRTVYITADGAAAALERWLTIRGDESGPLFTPIKVNGHIGRVGAKVRRKEQIDARPLARLTPEGIYKVFIGRAREAGLVDEGEGEERVNVRPHDMRRTMISLYFESGIDVAIMKRLTGHVKTDTLIGYDRRPARAAAKAASVIVLPERLRDEEKTHQSE